MSGVELVLTLVIKLLALCFLAGAAWSAWQGNREAEMSCLLWTILFTVMV